MVYIGVLVLVGIFMLLSSLKKQLIHHNLFYDSYKKEDFIYETNYPRSVILQKWHTKKLKHKQKGCITPGGSEGNRLF